MADPTEQDILDARTVFDTFPLKVRGELFLGVMAKIPNEHLSAKPDLGLVGVKNQKSLGMVVDTFLGTDSKVYVRLYCSRTGEIEWFKSLLES